MALTTLLLPIPSLLFGSALWTLTPKQYRLLHHGGTLEENNNWMSSHGKAMPAEIGDDIQHGWHAPLRLSSGQTRQEKEAAHLDLDIDQLQRVEQVYIMQKDEECDCVDRKQLTGALEQLGDRFHTKHEVAALMHRYDLDESQHLEKEEFMAMAAQKLDDMATLHVAFAAFDTDEDGRISYPAKGDSAVSELRDAARKLGGLTSELTTQNAKSADQDNDGKLTEAEFTKMMTVATERHCVAIMYLDSEALSEAVEAVPLLLAVIAGNVALVGGVAGMPQTYPIQAMGVGIAYLFASLVRIWLVRGGMSAGLAGVLWVLFGLVGPLYAFSKLCLTNAGLSKSNALAVLVAYLVCMATLVDLAYRHFFLSLLERGMLSGFVAVALALLVPTFLQLLNNITIAREWRKVEPMLPFERARPFSLCAYLIAARAQREMLADIYLSANNWPLAYPAMLLMAGGRYYMNRASAKLVDKGTLAHSNQLTRFILPIKTSCSRYIFCVVFTQGWSRSQFARPKRLQPRGRNSGRWRRWGLHIW